MGRVPRKIILASVAVLALAGMFAASAALAQDRSADERPGADSVAGNASQKPDGAPPGGRGIRERHAQIARNTMRISREIYFDGRTVTVTTDRGELVSVGDSSLRVKYLDGSESDVQVAGELKVCASGNPNAGLGDLQTGKPVGIHKATNLPGGDLTVVVQITEKPREQLKGCKDLLKVIKDKMKTTESP